MGAIDNFSLVTGSWSRSLCTSYFSSASVVLHAFSVLCVCSMFGHHHHPLCYPCAQFRFCRALRCWASLERSRTQSLTQSLTHPAYYTIISCIHGTRCALALTTCEATWSWLLPPSITHAADELCKTNWLLDRLDGSIAWDEQKPSRRSPSVIGYSTVVNSKVNGNNLNGFHSFQAIWPSSVCVKTCSNISEITRNV